MPRRFGVDAHHTVEDVGLSWGKLWPRPGQQSGIARFGTAFVPMDEVLMMASVDISRPFAVSHGI